MSRPQGPASKRVPRRQVAILAYGSLIEDPGYELAPLVVDREERTTPFRVEFCRASRRWGEGPVLAPHPAGAYVAGELLVLHPGVGLGRAMELLRRREGMPPADAVVEVGAAGRLVIIAAALPHNLPRPDMRPRALARRAATSVVRGPRNGVAYLRAVLATRVRTPLTQPYADELLSLSQASTLEEAERRLVALAAGGGGRADGLG
jgi:hypothetical protein